MIIAPITEENFLSVAQIYSQGISTGMATFETLIPSWDSWNKSHLEFGRIVAIQEGGILGWAALSPVSKRSVYIGVAEVSVYVSENARGSGVGEFLLKNLITISESNGVWTLQSSIFPENKGSAKLHKKCGFRIIGVKERIGQLANGEWKDNIMMERRSKRVGV